MIRFGPVRRATATDVAAVVALGNPERNRIGFLPTGALRERIADGHCFVIDDHAGGLAAYLVGRPSMRQNRRVRPITQVVVRPDARRHGLATALVQHVALDARVNGRWMLQAWTRQDLPANGLWEAIGFTAIAVRSPKTARQKAAILWRLPLTAEGQRAMWDVPRTGGLHNRPTNSQALFDWTPAQVVTATAAEIAGLTH